MAALLQEDLQPAPWARTNFLIISLCLILFLIILPVVWLVKTRQADPIFAAASCPDGWVGYLGRCYYFSEAEGDWNNSQSSCSSLGASLAGIDNEQEKAFMLRYKGPADHWIGLHRALGQPWKWANGTEFNNWFEIKGGGLCAYMNSDAIASSGCLREGHWVCSRPAEKTEGNACG
ncbi:C-type lectin domain family 2 member D-like [Carettochelys insculpta]|uniref:C-type lectin domain family 2 member D-like n=1 Tax=Carettochelys insculpta TaxID=44489 RepID=UPI003EBE1229